MTRLTFTRGWGRPKLLLALAAVAALASIHACATRVANVLPAPPPGLEPAEFSRLVQAFSEDGGFFRSDNFTSNETSYLHVAGKLRERGGSGGAYVGVGPEQNFTYIAKLRPQIAFILDIRRQAVLQHLLYKALFHMSASRAEFLSRLLSRPLLTSPAPGKDSSAEQLIQYFTSAPVPSAELTANLDRILKTIQQQFLLPLGEQDQKRLEYVYSVFHKEGLDISYQSGETRPAFRRFPSLGELIVERDLQGNSGNFLATEEDYLFVRGMHLQNRIIPVVGDFAGERALSSIAEYLRAQGHVVRAFYTSNVEQFLFQNAVFGAFVANVRKLPIDSQSVFIRAIPMRGEPHPAQVQGHRMATVLQEIPVFLKDYDAGVYIDHRTLVTTHFIAGSP